MSELNKNGQSSQEPRKVEPRKVDYEPMGNGGRKAATKKIGGRISMMLRSVWAALPIGNPDSVMFDI